MNDDGMGKKYHVIQRIRDEHTTLTVQTKHIIIIMQESAIWVGRSTFGMVHEKFTSTIDRNRNFAEIISGCGCDYYYKLVKYHKFMNKCMPKGLYIYIKANPLGGVVGAQTECFDCIIACRDRQETCLNPHKKIFMRIGESIFNVDRSTKYIPK